MSESEGAGMRRRLPGALPAAPTSPLEDDGLLREILVRLPTQPSSLPRASAVCTRWRGLVTDPKFLRFFRVHHRKPPLLGFIERSYSRIEFIPILDPPNRILPELLECFGPCSDDTDDVLDCRHGLVLLSESASKELVVCDPITGEQRHVPVPPEFNGYCLTGAVLCSAVEQGRHVHGSCHSSPFKVVVLLRIYTHDLMACVYSSKTSAWGDLVSRVAPSELYATFPPATLIGNALYWLSYDCIVEFDLDENNLAVLEGPPGPRHYNNSQIIQPEDGVLGLATLSFPGLRMWYRDINCHGVATWVPWKTIERPNIFGLPPTNENGVILGYSEATEELCLYLEDNIYMVQLKSMQTKILPGIFRDFQLYPFTSFYTPGTAIRGCDEADMLHNQ